MTVITAKEAGKGGAEEKEGVCFLIVPSAGALGLQLGGRLVKDGSLKEAKPI